MGLLSVARNCILTVVTSRAHMSTGRRRRRSCPCRHRDPHRPPPSPYTNAVAAGAGAARPHSSCGRHRCCCSRLASSAFFMFLFGLWLLHVAVPMSPEKNRVFSQMFLSWPLGLGAFATGLNAESPKLSAPHRCRQRSSWPVPQCT